MNGYRQEGFAAFDRNISRGRRLSAARAYLHPAMSRPNLRVVTRAHTTRILFSGTRATGVEFVLRCGVGVRGAECRPPSPRRRAYGGEVIVCAGAFGSPQLLQLSGVGQRGRAVRARHRRGRGPAGRRREPAGPPGGVRPVRVQAAGLGRARAEVAEPAGGGAALGARRGPAPGATNHFEAGGFARSNDVVRYPNLMFHFLPIAIRYDGSAPAGGHGYQVHIGPMYSDSRGSVKIKSADPFAQARRCGSTTCPRRPTGRSGPRRSRSRGTSSTSPRSTSSTPGSCRPGRRFRPSRRCSTGSRGTRRPRCTRPAPARWAPGRWRSPTRRRCGCTGSTGLRVVDASVMPYVTNGNIYAPVMMIAEKAADLIAGNTPLPPQQIRFYRHNSDDATGRPGRPRPPGELRRAGRERRVGQRACGWRPRPHDGTNLRL